MASNVAVEGHFEDNCHGYTDFYPRIRGLILIPQQLKHIFLSNWPTTICANPYHHRDY
jgi:hypothetical protein